MHFSVIQSLTLQINLPLKLETDHFFVSVQMYKISRGSNIFFPLFIYIYIYTVGTESIQTPLNFSLFVILQPFAKII